MLIRIEIDTNNARYNQDKYPWNEELWNILVPNIKYLETYEGLQPSEEINWEITKQYFKDGNGHCIIQKETGTYIAAYEYTSLYLENDFLRSVSDFIYNKIDLSTLLAEIAIKNNIDWKYKEEYLKENSELKNKPFDTKLLISIFNQYKLVSTPLQKITK